MGYSPAALGMRERSWRRSTAVVDLKRKRSNPVRPMLALVCCCAFLLLNSAAAHATTLTTPALSAGSDGTAQCELVNLGTTPINVTLLPVRITPGPVSDPIACPGLAQNSRCFVQIPGTVDVLCKFTFIGSKTTVRAIIETLTAGGTTTAALPAS